LHLKQRCAKIRNEPTPMSRTRQPSTRRIGAAERAIALLDTLAEAGELGTNEIARRTGMTPSTVSRQLGTLAASGLAERIPTSGRYRLGIRLVHLANAVLARLDVREVARPHLVALVEATGETATLSVPGDEDAITVDFVPGAHQVQPVSRLGRPSIAHATSAGKVMLSFSGRELPEGPFRAYTPRTITDARALAREIQDVLARGYAQAIGEREPGLTAIAAPIRSSRGELEAIVALQGPSERFDAAAVEEAVPLLLERAAAVSRELGWRPAPHDGS
jgi:DNA-binding IclR family transcriptional regulator